MAHSKNLLLDVLCKFVSFFFLNIVLIYEFVGLCIGRNTGSRRWAPTAKTNYNCFYVFQICIIYDFGRILNSLAILFQVKSKPCSSQAVLYLFAARRVSSSTWNVFNANTQSARWKKWCCSSPFIWSIINQGAWMHMPGCFCLIT